MDKERTGKMTRYFRYKIKEGNHYGEDYYFYLEPIVDLNRSWRFITCTKNKLRPTDNFKALDKIFYSCSDDFWIGRNVPKDTIVYNYDCLKYLIEDELSYSEAVHSGYVVMPSSYLEEIEEKEYFDMKRKTPYGEVSYSDF